MVTIQVNRGLAAGLPVLASGEPGWTTDTHALYMGTGSGNVFIGAGRTLTGPAAGITVTNGSGVSGNPTLALANDLAGVEGLAGTGLAVRTATDTWTTRTITGTSNRLTVTNGDGVSGNPTLDIHASYAGQTSITTLGTVTSGTWSATAIAAAKGGTGLDGSAAANGSLPIGNGSGYTLSTITAGANAFITNGAGSITISPLSAVTTITADTTLSASHSTVLCNNSGADITVTLPAASGCSGRRYVIKKINSAAKTVTVAGNGADPVETAVTSLVLYVQYDTVEIVSDGSKWHLVADGRKAHVAKMRRATAQAVTSGAFNKASLSTVDFDNAGICDSTTNFRFTVKRAGKYLLTGAWQSGGSPTIHQASFYLNGSQIDNGVFTDATTGGTFSTTITTVVDLAAGDYVELWLYQNTGSNQNTVTTLGQQPRMTVTEIRP